MAAAYSLPINLLRDKASHIDLNGMFGGPTQQDLLFDKAAITQSIMNIFKTPIGEAGPIFEPEFGSPLYQLLQEPFDDLTAAQVRAASFQAIQRWEPRVEIDFSLSGIELDYRMPGYKVTLVYRIRHSGETASTAVTLPAL